MLNTLAKLQVIGAERERGVGGCHRVRCVTVGGDMFAGYGIGGSTQTYRGMKKYMWLVVCGWWIWDTGFYTNKCTF